MSKLTNFQLRATIEGMERSQTRAIQKGDFKGVRRRGLALQKYRDELKERENSGYNPGTEIQTSHLEPIDKGQL